MKTKFILVFLFEIFNLSAIFSKTCEESDIGQHITKCDELNKRKGMNINLY
jgi:hypothetical protein